MTLGLGVSMFLPARFATNDDTQIMLALSGHLTGGPGRSDVYFQSILGAEPIRYLFAKLPILNWYTLRLALSHVLAMTCAAYLVFRVATTRLAWSLVLLLFVTFDLYFLTSLQFTQAAAAMSAAGYLVLIASERDLDGRHMAFAGFMCVLGASIRFEAFMLVSLILATSLGGRILRGPLRLRFLLSIASIALVVAGMRIHDRAHYSADPEWREYLQFSRAVSRLKDTPWHWDDPELIDRVVAEVGWTDDTWWLFDNWYFQDPEVMTPQAVARLADELGFWLSWKGVLGTVLYQARAPFRELGFMWPVLAIAAVPFLYVVPRERMERYVWRLGIAYVPCGALIASMIATQKFPARISVSMAYTLGALTVLEVVRAVTNSPGRPVRGIRTRLLAVGATLIVAGSCVSVALITLRTAEEARTNRELESALLADPDMVYALGMSGYLDTFRPWRNPAHLELKLFPSAGFWRTPFVGEVLRRQLGEESWLEALGTNDRIRLVGVEPFFEALRGHYRHFHGIQLKFTPVQRYRDLITVQVERAEERLPRDPERPDRQ